MGPGRACALAVPGRPGHLPRDGVRVATVNGEGPDLLSAFRRTTMSRASTQKRAVVKDQQGTRVHQEHLADVPEALEPDDLQRDLQRLLRRLCEEDLEQEAE
ncbi:hypothetical protein PAL_GLEAN10013857 [Pteropus alecto]|uniref:Uncharacterized protein n=1 Tax=Pteropus alecto TaxID=9402 RepID=L5KAR4_PTEAL|nr:hypothetical protein PAL_GLEAN10013857 [Pteropus alecto]